MTTYWNGEPAPARRVRVKIKDEPQFSHYWAATEGLIGTMRDAVEVTYGDQVFYLERLAYLSEV